MVSASHQSSFFKKGGSSSLMRPRNVRSFFGDEQQQLPMTDNSADSYGSSSNSSNTTTTGPLSPPSPPSSADTLRLAPGRSLSSSAALLRQRAGSSSPSSSRVNVRKAYSSESTHLPQPPAATAAPDIPYGQHQHQPVGPYSSLYYASSNKNGNGKHTGWSILVQALVVFTFMGMCVVGRMLQEHNMELRHTLELREHEIDHHIEHADGLERKVQRLRNEAIHLRDQIESLEEKPAMGMTELQRQLFHMEHHHNLIHQGIQLSDRRMIREKFGLGPRYYVEMKLQFPARHQEDQQQQSQGQAAESSSSSIILMETADIDDMPHTIHLFLEQVSHGLYDGTYFHRNAQHIVQAGPSHSAKAHARFRHHPSLNSVLFQEYSRSFPHDKYTLGYPGRPGGPDFYINLRDNSELHGPGGQANHYVAEESFAFQHQEADPCFAKVIDGYDVVDKIHDMDVDWQDVLVQPIQIKYMRIVSKQEYQQKQKSNSADKADTADASSTSSSHHHDHQHYWETNSNIDE